MAGAPRITTQSQKSPLAKKVKAQWLSGCPESITIHNSHFSYTMHSSGANITPAMLNLLYKTFTVSNLGSGVFITDDSSGDTIWVPKPN